MTEFRPGGFQLIPTVIKNLIIINVLIYLAQSTLGDAFNTKLINLFALHDIRSPLFRPHQLVTYLFLHGGWDHVLYNMLALWVFGSILENYWGPKRFLVFYIICGLGAAVAHLAVLYPEMTPYFNDLHQYQNLRSKRGLCSTRANRGMAPRSAPLVQGIRLPGRHRLAFPQQPHLSLLFCPCQGKMGGPLLRRGGTHLRGINPTAGDNVAHWAHLGGGWLVYCLSCTGTEITGVKILLNSFLLQNCLERMRGNGR